MNKLDKEYTDLLQDILDNGVEKKDRTGTGTISIFGRQIRHKMSDGFPLLTGKKMFFKGIVTELLWFLRGDTNIKYLVDNGCHVWDGDCFANYVRNFTKYVDSLPENSETEFIIDKDKFINKIKTDDEFAKRWGELGPIYGKQWRSWTKFEDESKEHNEWYISSEPIDQIAGLISELKTNPDSRRLMVSAWNVGELDQMVLPPCHYGFQVYTRELSLKERNNYYTSHYLGLDCESHKKLDELGDIPTRAISLMWNQRSVDTFLGLPFNIASYGLLLEIIAKAVNMIPDELIGNLGDVHLYSNHIEQAKEQIGRKYTADERTEMLKEAMGYEAYHKAVDELMPFGGGLSEYYDFHKIPHHTREPYPLPTLNINTEFWPYEGGECGVGPLDAVAVFNSFRNDDFCRCLLEEDIQLSNYQSHPTIKAPLSN
jgi:thymidylate synthase